MQRKGANISLKGYDDIFSTEQSRAESQQERVQEIPLSELHPFEGHPFRVVDDEEMMKTAESVRDFGVLTPAIVRPDPDGGYEIVSGHRRHRASELAGKKTMPAIVRDLDDDAAIILMVDANLQRESILPSERAFAYKMKLDAIKHQGQRTDLTSSQVGMKLQAMDIVGQEAGESRNQVHRYIRLTELIPELLDMVDRIRLEQRGLIDIHKKLYEMEHLLPIPDPMQFAKTAESAALLSEKSTAHLRNMFFSVSNEPPIYYYPKAAEAQGIRVWASDNYLRVLLPALLPDKKKRNGCKFLLLPLQAALVQSKPLPHFSDCVICVEHIYDHNLPIKAVRDYDNLELKAVIDVIATFCLADDTGALCDSFQTTRFGYSSSTVITVMPKKCFSAWLSAPKSAENRPPLFPKNS